MSGMKRRGWATWGIVRRGRARRGWFCIVVGASAEHQGAIGGQTLIGEASVRGGAHRLVAGSYVMSLVCAAMGTPTTYVTARRPP